MIAPFARVVRDLEAIGAPFALVGGFAVSVRAEPRFTRDVDVAVAVPDDAAAEQVVRALAARGYRPVALVEQDRTGRRATVRLDPPADRDVGVVDLLFASSSIEDRIVAMDDRTRPQDRVDALKLLAGLSDPDRGEVLDALDEITRRGANRGRDLRALYGSLTA